MKVGNVFRWLGLPVRVAVALVLTPFFAALGLIFLLLIPFDDDGLLYMLKSMWIYAWDGEM